MSWLEKKEELLAQAHAIDPSIVLVSTKDSILCKIIAWTRFILSLGFLKREDFYARTAWTLAHRVYLPEEWTEGQASRVVPHEAFHTKRCRKLALGRHPIFGLLQFLFIYFFVPIPMGLAWFRFQWEVEAEIGGWVAQDYKILGNAIILELIDQSLDNFCGIKYFFSWPRDWGKEYMIRKATEAGLLHAE